MRRWAVMEMIRAVEFDTFAWDLTQDDVDRRMWTSTDGTLMERFFDIPPDFGYWDADKIRRDVIETQGYLRSPTFTRDSLPEMMQRQIPAELPQQATLLDVEIFEVHPAKGVLVTSRVRTNDAVHYFAVMMLLFAECFWVFTIDLQESGEVGQREGEVARIALDTPVDGAELPEFDPYERKWDGIVPLEADPLARLRILAASLVDSFALGEAVTGLRPFEPSA